jgi:hypothetical protein
MALCFAHGVYPEVENRRRENRIRLTFFKNLNHMIQVSCTTRGNHGNPDR